MFSNNLFHQEGNSFIQLAKSLKTLFSTLKQFYQACQKFKGEPIKLLKLTLIYLQKLLDQSGGPILKKDENFFK